ncbi:MAG: FxsA cytoplasmic rane protein [Frankiales bacterium]|nr:FxsA cytoplasmic rane protein [Frankiales bacterium]
MPVLIALGLTFAVEVVVLIMVGEAIGAIPTLLLMLATSALGAYLLRREGARAYRAFAQATAAGQVPAREAADGALILVGGLLLLLPGFVSDVVGLLLLTPPTRRMLRGPVTTLAARKLLGPGFARILIVGRPGRRSGRIVDGEVVEGRVVRRPDEDGRPPLTGG